MTWQEAIDHDLQPGDTIVMKDGSRLLVGDINPAGGVCDDCLLHARSADVVDHVERKGVAA